MSLVDMVLVLLTSGLAMDELCLCVGARIGETDGINRAGVWVGELQLRWRECSREKGKTNGQKVKIKKTSVKQWNREQRGQVFDSTRLNFYLCFNLRASAAG